ncbi:hypothetical protein GCM10025867_43030 [Frondihabitans sucicola]|uniref:Sulfatase n=1 Tax=Frondihabitans sucicola TaxID=1268041 RepID=A0ABN6Y3Z2_9MICO|nr:hypothetical protein GCM10025867_43030 [Frondihabitans sucicola]
MLGAAVLSPGLVASGSPAALLRVPLEAAAALLVLAVLPWRPVRRVAAGVLALLFVLTILSAALDRGFTSTVGIRFNPITGWPELRDGFGVLRDSTGSTAAFGILIALVLASVAATIVIGLSLLRLDGVGRRHRRQAAFGAGAVVAAWAVVGLVGAQVVPGQPIAATDAIGTIVSRSDQAAGTAHSEAAFDGAQAKDPFSAVPSSDLLAGLTGKDVIVAFIESYGQVAVQNSSFSPGVDRVLKQGDAQLAADGYSERSAFLTSPTFGGISWLAHSTLQTGQWIDSQQRYDKVTSGSRFTLSDAFGKAGWRTLSDVPSDSKPWPVGKSFYHFGTELNSENVGYRGPRFSYAKIPDQYTWSYLQKTELSKPHTPLMAEVDFVSSHTPWTPLPHLVPWPAIGDGSVFDPQPAEGLAPKTVWQDPHHVQQLYGQSIEYSMSSLFSFVHTFDDPNLVLVVLGDHQPATEVSGEGANHDVPISIISKDPGVLDRISSWNWQPSMLPSPSAPVWRMDDFRDRFLTAYDRARVRRP